MISKEETLEINKRQKEFYNTKKRNFVTSLWSKIRHGLLADIRKEIGMSDQVYELHKKWLGDLSDKKVLDLGCFAGNSLSIYIAERAKEYIGLDLSDVGIDRLNNRLKDISSAKGIAADFLSETEFPDKDFDIIYAYGVIHHFPNMDVLINRLNQKLNENGVIITYDPLETSFPVKLVRSLYRPFQSDADWEWPFTKATIKKLSNSYKIIERRGLLGKTKWFMILNLLPISKDKKVEIGKKWHQSDWNLSSTSDKDLLACMHLTMLMKKN